MTIKTMADKLDPILQQCRIENYMVKTMQDWNLYLKLYGKLYVPRYMVWGNPQTI